MKPNFPLTLRAEPLEAAAFAAYGEIVQHRGDAMRHHLHVPFQHKNDAVPAMWVNRLHGHSDATLAVDVMERHPNSAQTFIPLHPTSCVAVTALSDAEGALDPSTLRAFVLAKGQGVSYRPMVWHFGFTSLQDGNEVVVVMAGTGRREDTEVIQLPHVVQVDLNVKEA